MARAPTPPPTAPIELPSRRSLVLGSCVGRGSRAAVYRAMLESEGGLRREVAVKLFDAIASDERELIVPRLGRVACQAAAVHHPNVVDTYEFGCFEKGKHPFIVSEFVDGRSLADLLDAFAARGQRLPPDLALYIGIEVAEALAGARGSVHGDLSARDVLLSWHGEVKVGDFGISAAVGAASAVRSRSAMSKRVVTLSPEVAQGERATARSDVFSLGVLLHVMLVGPRFAKDVADDDVILGAVEGTFEPVLFGPRPPTEIMTIIEAATVPDPHRRLDDAGALAYELRREAMALGVGDGRIFLRHTLEGTLVGNPALDGDGPTGRALRDTERPPSRKARAG